MTKVYFKEVTERYYKLTSKPFSNDGEINSEINVTPDLYEEFLVASITFEKVQLKILEVLIEQQKLREA